MYRRIRDLREDRDLKQRQLAAFRAERQLVRQQRESQKNEKSDQRRQENRRRSLFLL